MSNSTEKSSEPVAAIGLRALAESLQTTSRALSNRGNDNHELAMLQESANMVLGDFMLNDLSPCLVYEGSAADITRSAIGAQLSQQDVLQVLAKLNSTVWVGADSGHAILLKSVANEDDWYELPVQLQNFVATRHFPCHLLVAVEQMEISNDNQFRHCAMPVLVVITRQVGSLKPEFFIVTSELRKTYKDDALAAQKAADAFMEPYMRILMAGILAMFQGAQ